MVSSGVCKKRKVQRTLEFTGLFGGELGIRTIDPFRGTAFRVRRQGRKLTEVDGR